jgi:polyisoprenoid-binding protein YceI
MNTRSLFGTALLLATALGSWNLPDPAPRDIDAQSGNYAVDGGHSTSLFGVRHLDVANFYGRFNTISGEFTLDMDNAEKCSIKVSIDPASLDTASDSRDNHIRSAEFLDVENFPLMSFKSTSFEAGEHGHWTVTGKLTLHGQTQEITLDADLIGAGKTAFGDYRVGLETTFTVLRSHHGMSAMLDKLGDEIRFTLSLEGRLRED